MKYEDGSNHSVKFDCAIFNRNTRCVINIDKNEKHRDKYLFISENKSFGALKKKNAQSFRRVVHFKDSCHM